MSLINQMLKDIDQRQGHAGSAGSGASGMALNVARNPSGAKAPVWLWGGILVLVVLAATYGLRHMTRQNTVPVTPNAEQAGASPGEGRPVAQAASVDMPVAVVPQGLVPPADPAAATADQPVKPAQVAGRERAPDALQTHVAREPEKGSQSVVTATAGGMTVPAQGKTDKRNDAPVPVSVLTPGQVTRVLSAEQRADNAYRDAAALLRQGAALEAQKSLRQALADQPTHLEARLLYAQVLQGEGRSSDAKAVLTEGITLKPQAFAFHAALAQMQLLGRETEQAVTTLERGLLAAGDNAAYHALLATALQQQAHHTEAVAHYVIALRQQPDSSNWLVGLGVSLQAQGQLSSAAEAYQRALDLGLPASLSQFARDRLQQVSR
jgi:MSHA biogenesis protein MshN